jgi:hypothetical protein
LLRSMGMSGCAFVARKGLIQRYILPPDSGHGIPIDRRRITLDGWITGLPLPPEFAHHMDDPRSPHCIFTKNDIVDNEFAQSALTARKLGFATSESYGKWIAADAARVLDVPFPEVISKARLERRIAPIARLFHKGKRILQRASGLYGERGRR